MIDWVGPRTKEFLLNPKRLLRPQDEVQLPKLPELKIAQELINRNVCDWVDLDSVYKVNGVPILNGLFGVPKTSQLSDGRPINLRFIMNLTGSNATQVHFLPSLLGNRFSLMKVKLCSFSRVICRRPSTYLGFPGHGFLIWPSTWW